MTRKGSKKIQLDWIDALKAFAIIGILLNHAVESFNIYPWFSNPSADWPSFAERMSTIFPQDGSILIRFVQFLGFLGDMGPGIFIFASGLTLTLSALNKPLNRIDFYKSRALRIYPLYVSIHLIILIIAIFLFKWGGKSLIFWSPLSILGLRFTNSLFFFLNPSWWFIWLILQLYLVFPFLFELLKKKGTAYFLITTLLITVASRTAGVLGYTFSAEMSKWMTGLFGGTRLIEFTFGMYIGFLIKNKNIRLTEILNDRVKLPLISIFLYAAGFVASWTYFGSIFSGILITIGLSGIFYSFYEFILKGHGTIENPILWIGKNAFSAFLIHQSFMIYFGSVLSGYSKTIVLGIIIIASFIFGNLIEKQVIRLTPFVLAGYTTIITFFKRKIGLILSGVSILGISVLSFFILLGTIRASRFILLIYLLHFSYLTFYRILVNPKFASWIYRYIDMALVISFVVLLFRGGWFSLFGILIIGSFLLLLILRKMRHWPVVIVIILLISSGIGAVEYYLKNYKPVEMNSWGELPALQIDNETVYSLIPNKSTHLKYNNYDYLVKTNSLGFASPEINFSKKVQNEFRIMIVGDAFSMPEGMEYEFSYPSLLEKKLSTQFPEKIIKVINAGVTGYGPNEERAQLKKYINTINPDIVINQLFVNEFLEIGLDREARLKDIGLIEKDIKKKKFRNKLRSAGRLQSIAQLSFSVKNYAGFNESFNYHKSLLFLYEKNSPLYSDSAIVEMNDYLVEMNDLNIRNNSKLVVLGVPGQIEVSSPKHISYFPNTVNLNDTSIFDLNLPLQIFQNLCKKNDIIYLNTKDVLKNYPEQPLYFEESWHWNQKGHSVIADFLFEFLKTDIWSK